MSSSLDMNNINDNLKCSDYSYFQVYIIPIGLCKKKS